MRRKDETTFALHGLSADNGAVRAKVFVQKINALILALQTADKIANDGKAGFDYLLTDLKKGSAVATLRERPKRAGARQSGIELLEATANAIYNGDRNLERLPKELIHRVQKIGQGAARTFSHAEIEFPDDTIIRIDDYLLRQSSNAIREVVNAEEESRPSYFHGVAFGTFDGFLKEIDSRGTVLRGKLVLTAGGLEIDCVMNKERVPEVRDSFDRHVVISGAAHYDGHHQIPQRLDVTSIAQVTHDADILRWKGAFKPLPIDDGDSDEW